MTNLCDINNLKINLSVRSITIVIMNYFFLNMPYFYYFYNIVASLLNCLYQLKNENRDLETKATELSKKRDQLLLINTRFDLYVTILVNF